MSVEEEFLLVWPDGNVASLAPLLLGWLPGEVRARATAAQYRVESATSACGDLPVIGRNLSIARRLLAEGAADLGARLLAVGTVPFGAPGREVTCACHVTVELPERDLCVAVLERLQPWLPALLALTGNSPLWRGSDTGWSSHRFAVERRSSTGIPRQRSIETAETPAGLVLARLSVDRPAVEIRLADTCPSVSDAVLLAGLCRALVWTAADDELTGRPLPDVPERVLRAVGEAAARHGLGARVPSPGRARLLPAAEVLGELVAAVAPALEAAGDAPLVHDLLADRLRRGSGADRQRTLWQTGDRDAFVQALANRCAGVEPAPPAGAPLTPLLRRGPWPATA